MCFSANTFKAWKKAISSSAAWKANTVAKRFARIMNSPVLQAKRKESQARVTEIPNFSYGLVSDAAAARSVMIPLISERGTTTYGEAALSFSEEARTIVSAAAWLSA